MTLFSVQPIGGSCSYVGGASSVDDRRLSDFTVRTDITQVWTGVTFPELNTVQTQYSDYLIFFSDSACVWLSQFPYNPSYGPPKNQTAAKEASPATDKLIQQVNTPGHVLYIHSIPSQERLSHYIVHESSGTERRWSRLLGWGPTVCICD